MFLRKFSALLLSFAFVSSLIFPMAAQAGQKRKLAILPFEYGAVQTNVGTVDVGKGITTLLITKLVNDGTYSIIERQMLDSILKEQNFSVSDRADQSTAIKIGKLLSIEAIVVGTVTQFGFESKSTNVGAGVGAATRYIPYVGGFGGAFGGVSVKKSKVQVALDARIIDVTTGEILGAVHGVGKSQRSGTDLWGGSGWSGGEAGWGSSDFATTIAGEATMQAVDDIGSQLLAYANKLPDNASLAAKNVTGKIADVTGTTVTVNLGKKNGLKVGSKLHIERPVKTIRDPDTGNVIKEIMNTVAEITLKEVDDASSTGDIVKGAGVKIGDTVKMVTTDVSAVVLGKDGKAPQ